MEIKSGAIVKACGEQVEVKEIIFQDIYLGDRWTKAMADVEFKDSKGNYRHWQSWSDGGSLIYEGNEYKFEKE